MADFQYPDLLGQYVRGQMAPGQIQGQQNELAAQQQGLTEGGLRIDQLRLALGNQQMYQDVAKQSLQGQGYLGGQPAQGSPAAGAQAPGGPTGGMQNGPQAGVAGTATGALGFSPSTLGALALLRGDDPLKTATGLQDYEKTQAQLQAQGPLNMMDSIFSSDQPAKTVMNNPSLIAQWPKFAQQIGVDPVTGFNDQNVRRALALAANNVRGAAGLPAKEYPVQVQNANLGQGEVGQIDPVTGKKVGDLVERQTPSYTLVDRYDPNTQTTTKIPVQTGGYGMSGVNPSKGAPPAAQGPAGFNTGYKPPSDPELKAAMFGSEMRSGLSTMDKMESQGFELSPKARAIAINMATEEGGGGLLGHVLGSGASQLASQELARHGLNAQEQTYIAAMMPLLQAAGHDQSGARLTTAQIRQNVESLLPIDVKNKDSLQQVRMNREGFYKGLLSQAGSAVYDPMYSNTLGADRKQFSGQSTNTSSAPKGMPSLDEIRAELARRKSR